MENVAESIEDLLRMGIIKFDDPSVVGQEKLSNCQILVHSLKDDGRSECHKGRSSPFSRPSATISHLPGQKTKLPRRLTMALANDIEEFQDSSQLSEFVRRYVMVLYNILHRN